MEKDVEFMGRALELAKEAAADGEVPVGCVIVRDGRIVGEGRNRREGDHNALAHAEVEAIREACAFLGDWRLEGCSLYVTLEPCSSARAMASSCFKVYPCLPRLNSAQRS